MRNQAFVFAILTLLMINCNRSTTNTPLPSRPIPGPPDRENIQVVCGETIAYEAIPQASKDFVDQYFSTFTVTEVEACTDSDGARYFEVEVQKGQEKYEIYFDAGGNFLAMQDDKGGTSINPPTQPVIPPDPGNGGNPETVRCDIDFNYDNLPQSVKDHISTYYPNFTIDDVDVCKDGNGNIVAYQVEIEQGDSEYWLYFDTEGNFLIVFDKFGNNTTEPPNPGNINPPGGGNEKTVYCGSEIPTSDVPQAILNDVATRFPDRTIDDVEVCHDEDGILAYDFELEGGAGEIHAFYDKDGNFLGTSNDDFDGDDDGSDVCTSCECDDCEEDGD